MSEAIIAPDNLLDLIDAMFDACRENAQHVKSIIKVRIWGAHGQSATQALIIALHDGTSHRLTLCELTTLEAAS